MDGKKRIVIFGATGHVASNLALDLANIYDVVAVGHRKSDNGFFAEYGIPYISVDVANVDSFAELPASNVFAVLHFAGALPAYQAKYNAQEYISSIVQGTFNVLEYTRKVGVERIVFPQTLCDIDYLFGSAIPIPSDAQRHAPLCGDHAMYVICKNAAVDMIEHYHKVYGLKRYIFRLSRIYQYLPDPYQWMDYERRLVSDRYLIYRAMQGLPLEIWGDPNRKLETMCIRDFEQMVRCALASECNGGLYNVGSGGTTLEDRVRGIAEVFSPKTKPCQIVYRPDKPNGHQFVLDYSKAERELGYKPKYSWKDYLIDFKHEMEIQRFRKLRGVERDYFDIDSLLNVGRIGRAGIPTQSLGNY